MKAYHMAREIENLPIATKIERHAQTGSRQKRVGGEGCLFFRTVIHTKSQELDDPGTAGTNDSMLP